MSKKNQLIKKSSSKEEVVEQLYQAPEYQDAYIASLPADTLARIKRSISSRRHGLQSVAPLMCGGPKKCLFIEHCPIPPRDEFGGPVYDSKGNQVFGPDKDYPIMRPCIMESLYMQQKILDYINYLDVDPGNPIEIAIVNELALIDLLKNRALIILSKGDRSGDGQDFLKSDVVGYDPDTGFETKTTTLHPAADYIDRLEKRRERWLDRLLETRKSKLEAATKLGSQNQSSKVLEEINSLKQALEDLAKKENTIEIAEIVEIPIDKHNS